MKRRMWIRPSCWGGLLLLPFASSAQDSAFVVQSLLPEVSISSRPTVLSADVSHTSPRYVLESQQLQQLGAADIGAALRFVPGVQLKDYGGIGGIKTVAYRSLGSAYTQLVLDGHPLLDVQTGTMNLSSFEVFGLSEMVFATGSPLAVWQPAAAYLPANTLCMTTAISRRPSAVEASAYQRVTTVRAYESAVLFRLPIGKGGFVGGQTSLRYGSGAYSYVYPLTGTTLPQRRTHSRLNSVKNRFVAGHVWKNVRWRTTVALYDHEQELPGAVILYNPSSHQELYHKNCRATTDVTWHRPRWQLRANGFYRSNRSRYYDGHVLNTAGWIDARYHQQNGGGGVVVSRLFKAVQQRLHAGGDVVVSRLNSTSFDASPERAHLTGVVGISREWSRAKVTSNLSYQFIRDRRAAADSVRTPHFSAFSPYFAVAVTPFEQMPLKVRFFYKHAFRMPSFNDLYYRLVGNHHLWPEEAHLLNVGLTCARLVRRHRLEWHVDGFLNHVYHQIVAIPTKDLFNWSMQNIGKVRTAGVDMGMAYLGGQRDWTWRAALGQTLQSAKDRTDKHAPSYNHQIPYTPFYAATVALSVGWRGYVLTHQLLYNGVRYALNENSAANYLSPFVDASVGIEKTVQWKRQKAVFHFQVNNIGGKNYEVVRSFPMPGRHCQLTIRYTWGGERSG